MSESIYGVSAVTLEGKTISLGQYRNKVLLIVNTASKCGFTPQYEGLEKLYRTYKDRGLVVIGFPCNQFGAQEPGDSKQIAEFCSLNYEVSFPMFAKVDVNGANTHPLYQILKREKSGFLGMEGIKWNFTKFLVDREGRVVDRFGPATPPAQLATDIERVLSTSNAKQRAATK